MVKAKIINKDGYKCAPLGYVVEHFAFGDTVTGKVAEWAIADGAAKRIMTKKAKGGAPENKGR